MTNYDAQFDRMFAHFDTMEANIAGLHQKITGLNTEITGLNTEITGLNTEIKQQGTIIKELKAENLTLKQEIIRLSEELVTVNNELAVVKGRLDTIEARLDLIDARLETFAPFLRRMLEDQDSLLLDKDYFTSIRDSEPETSFTPAINLLKFEADYPDWVGKFKNAHGLSSAFGKRLSNFYHAVTDHAPRQFQSRYKYWLEAEDAITDCVLANWAKVFRM